jgi:hypothetical protein
MHSSGTSRPRSAGSGTFVDLANDEAVARLEADAGAQFAHERERKAVTEVQLAAQGQCGEAGMSVVPAALANDSPRQQTRAAAAHPDVPAVYAHCTPPAGLGFCPQPHRAPARHGLRAARQALPQLLLVAGQLLQQHRGARGVVLQLVPLVHLAHGAGSGAPGVSVLSELAGFGGQTGERRRATHRLHCVLGAYDRLHLRQPLLKKQQLTVSHIKAAQSPGRHAPARWVPPVSAGVRYQPVAFKIVWWTLCRELARAGALSTRSKRSRKRRQAKPRLNQLSMRC